MAEKLNWAEVNAKNIAEFRANGGKLGGLWADSTVLLLHTIGARSGQPRINPLTYLADGDRYVVFASVGGAPRHPDWYRNLVAHPDVQVEVGDRSFAAVASVAEEPERSELYARQAARLPRFGEYQKKTTRTIPVVVLTPVTDGAAA